MLKFLENNLKLDASGLNIGNGATITAKLTLDQRDITVTTFNVVVPLNPDNSIPYTATLTTSDNQNCLLTITFNQPIANVYFDFVRTLVINDTFNLNVEINYANSFINTDWTNSSESLSINNIDLRGPITSTSLNNKLRGLLHSTINGLNQVKNYVKYYSFKEKYLSDIIDFVIAGGASMEPSNSIIEYNSDDYIMSITTTFSTLNRRTQKIKISYDYEDFPLVRLRKRDSIYTDLATENATLLNSFTIDAVDDVNNLIYRLGKITLNRTSNIYPIFYIKEYDSQLSDTDPINILSDYKYYRNSIITGWTVE